MSWISRFAHVASVSYRSSSTFANLGTIITSFLITPLLDITFSVLMGMSLSSPNLVRTGYASSLVGATITVCTTMPTIVAHDKDQGILQDILLHKKVDFAYWLGVSVPGLLLAAGTGAIAMLAVLAVDTQHSMVALTRALSLLLPALVSGILLGVCVSGAGLPLADSFMPVNTLTPLLPIIAGVVVPLHYYPRGIRSLLQFLPASSYIAALENGAPMAYVLAREALTGCVWAGIGILCSLFAARSWKRAD